MPEELAGACARFGMSAMALVDRNGVYGAPRFHMAAKKAGIRAHIGSEITCTNGASYPLLAETRQGYQNLCRLVTRMKLRAAKGEGAATQEELAEFSQGLICLTRHPSERLLEIFGPRHLYAEIQRHYDREEEAHSQATLERARRLGIPLVVSNGPAYATPAQRELLDVFTCVRHKTTLTDAGRLLERNSERHVKTPAEMAALFADLPEALRNTLEISARLEFTLADLGYEFPRYPVAEGETQMSVLRQRVEEGAHFRYRPYHERARRQIERELALIEKLGLPGYFLIVWDIVRFCRENGILAQGRGSAANSAVCYALRITAVDPVGMELLFERFLSEERGEWPDIDIDLPSGEQREKVIQYVYQRFGRLGAAMTANVITYRGRSAAREVGKALGFEVSTFERLAGLAHEWEWKDPQDTTERQFQQAGLDLQQPRVRKFFELYRMAQDLPRHLGQHSGGMVICQGQLDSVVPLEPATMPGRVVVQWDKEDCADMGIIKVDLLGLGMMAAIEDCLKLIPPAYGEEVDLARLPQDDPAVFEALQKADTVGMFQVESRAQMASLPRMRPNRFYDIVVQVALIRPGPIVGKMVHPYLNRRQGREAPDCLHPSLEPVLRRTLGVPLFQEQLLRMAMIAAGFTGGQAEELRRAMGFKRSEKRMADIEVKLRDGMRSKGIEGAAQDAIVRSITSFALYGFPESHAASFALLAYASAYLKCHYLAAFTCALLNNQPMGFYPPAILIKDAQRHGLRVLPVDVAESDWPCTLEKGTVPFLRLGLRYARGLREEAGPRHRARAPVLERRRPGPARPRAAQGRDQPPGRDRRAPNAGGASPRRPLADPARHPAGGPPAGAARRNRRTFAAGPHEYRRAPVGRLPGHGLDHRKASHGLSPRGDAGARRDPRRRPGRDPRRPRGAHRRIGRRAPASRHGQGLRIPQPGRRNRNHERHRRARYLRTLQIPVAGRSLPVHRGRVAKPGRSGFGEGGADRRSARGSCGGLARFPLDTELPRWYLAKPHCHTVGSGRAAGSVVIAGSDCPKIALLILYFHCIIDIRRSQARRFIDNGERFQR